MFTFGATRFQNVNKTQKLMPSSKTVGYSLQDNIFDTSEQDAYSWQPLEKLEILVKATEGIFLKTGNEP